MRFLNDILIEAGLIVDGTVQINTIPAATTDTDTFMVSDGGVMKSRTGAQLASDIDAMTKAVYDTDGDGIVDDAEKITVIARNSTGSTIYKGTIVYLQGSTGNRPNMLKAQANSEPTSSKTFGVVVADVANNADGEVAALGTLHDLDTRSGAPNPFTSDTLLDGDALWLSPATAGYVTRTKPTAPNHAVFIGIVARTSPTNGRIVYRIQNGYELEELHNVSALTPNNNDGIFYNSATGLWEAKSIATAAGGTIGTVTSVAMTVPTGLQIGGSPITTSGTLALTYASGYAIPTTVKQSNWDDAYTWVANFPTQTGNSGKYLTTDGNTLSWATVTAGISGSGTTNYLPKWTGATALGNSQIFDNGTSVGIGTATPSASFILDINGSANISSSVSINTIKFSVGLGGNTTNIGIGTSALASTTTSQFNVSIGQISGAALTSGNFNTFVGYNAGNALTTGAQNAFFGHNSGRLLTTSSYNAFYGQNAGRDITAGNDNVMVGQSSGFGFSSGSRNVILGGSSGGATRTGDDNIHIGYNSGTNNNGGVYNIFIGRSSGQSITAGSYNVVIGGNNGSSIAASSNVILLADGQGNERFRIPSTGNLLIGTTTDAGYKLDVAGSVRSQSLLVHNPTYAAYNLSISNIGNAYHRIVGGYGNEWIEFGGPAGNLVNIISNAVQLTTGIVYTSAGAQIVSAGTSGLVFSPANLYQQGDTRYGFTFTGNLTGAIASGVSELYLTRYNPTTATSVGQINAYMVGVEPIINTTGGTTIFRGFYYNPTVTGTTGLTNIAFESTAGIVKISDLSGSGSRMVVADSSGVLSTQAIPSGGATGSGTTNYITKWTGTTSLGDSQIFDNGTSVGIGTATPSASYILDITNSTRISRSTNGNLDLFVHNTNSGSSALSRGVFRNDSNLEAQFFASSSTWAGYGSMTANAAGLYTNMTNGLQLAVDANGAPIRFMLGNGNPTTRMTLTASGRLLIGTTTESTYELDVVGDIRSTLDANINGLTVGKGGGSVASNTAVGISVISGTATGTQNTGVGNTALRDLSSGSSNTAVGQAAGRATTTGANNVFMGFAAGIVNVSGGNNTALGTYAGYSLTGSSNTYLGYYAGFDATSGSGNTIVGNETGRGITTGNYNTIIGANVSGLSSSLSNTIILADGQGNQRLYIDNIGEVGIGTTTPSSKLHVVTGNVDGIRVESSNSAYIELGKTGGERWAFRNNYNSNLFELMYGAGGTTPLTTRFSIIDNGNFQIGSIVDQGYRLFVNGSIGASGNVVPNYLQSGQYINATTALRFFTNSTERAQITNAGRLLLGTTTESTFLLDVNGTARVSGAAGGTSFINTTNTGFFGITNNNGASYHIYYRGTTGVTEFYGILWGNPSGDRIYSEASLPNLIANGSTANFRVQNGGFIRGYQSKVKIERFDPNLTNAINLELDDNGTTPHSNYKPFVVKVNGVEQTHFDQYGGGHFGTSTSVSSAILSATSTTKGFLPPRMTSTQRAAISSPAVGLVVYQTDGSEGLYENTSTGWRIVNAAGGGSGTVTSVALATGTSGTDVNVSGSPITTSGTITLNIPDASSTARGLITTGTQTIVGQKTLYSGTTILDSNQSSTLLEGRASGTLYGGIFFGPFVQFNAYSSATSGYLWKNGSGNNVMAITQAGQVTIDDLAGTGTRMVVVSSTGALSTQAIPSGGSLSGTGTTNYLSKWTSSTALGDSLVYDNGTSVGVGTASPSASYKLDVSGDFRATNITSANTFTGQDYLYAGALRVHGTGATGSVSLLTNSSTRLQVTNGGNVLIGTTTDSGEKLQVNGTSKFVGDIQAYTYITLVANEVYMNWPSSAGAGTTFYAGNANYGTGANCIAFHANTQWSPGSGTTTFTTFRSSPIINQIGTATGVSRGLHIQPTLTNAVDWRSIEWSNNTGFGLYGSGTATNYLNGTLSIGNTSPSASAILQADSTTKGFLPPRMTETQKNAISTPATGLIVYQTDGTAGLYVYTGAAWKSLAIVA